ncbi:small glutamine-rich tetratricopeptide repeat-containing protein 2 isoform X1 [Cucurbita maxima]|uniref:Small glutamine-rich tetratricopeptide repeat-containing protein 2 isoform X1 n=1 Tax=Cucurbita maxima TaxID=3661 RepID=A0A6J1ISS6_CUCMA|nr:small glutamine-rich tetratricopeptide repeat-containing protein 2 isoform X1 [Cucurbita maxima]XP_022980998.1 small glutamine-rich tetratricopeptide repeat-containing protein 2 isoform X1 [Cucurbita maxima]
MANMRTDSPVACRIVRAFLDFLNSVEPGPGVDVEGIEVAKQCLEQVFKVQSPAAEELAEFNSLVDIFSSPGSFQRSGTNSSVDNGTVPMEHCSSLNVNDSGANLSKSSRPQGDDCSRESHPLGVLQDELFGQFVLALEKLRYFRTSADGRDDPDQLERATRLFHDALGEMERSGCAEINHKNLAESLKSLGLCSQNYSPTQLSCIVVQSHYVKIMPFTTVTELLRAAAYTQIQKYSEATRDSLKSIEIDPNYSKAYSRLGLALYDQGSYRDAIDKGFMKALQLDPNNEAVRENIRVAEQKLKEAQRQTHHEQGSSSRSQESQYQQSSGASRNDSPSPPFPSMPFNGTLPSEISNIFMNMAANHGQHTGVGGEENRSGNGSADDPRTNMDANFSFSVGDGMPQDLNGALRSMMQMFTGAAPGGNPQDNINRRPPQG